MEEADGDGMTRTRARRDAWKVGIQQIAFAFEMIDRLRNLVEANAFKMKILRLERRIFIYSLFF